MLKNYRKLLVFLTVFAVLLFSTHCFAGAKMPRDSGPGHPPIPVFTPPAISPVVTVAGAGDVDVSDYTVIMIGSDVEIYWGSDSSNTYPYVANTPLGISEGVTTIHVDAACAILVFK